MHVESVDGRDWCSLATIVLIGAGQLSHPLGCKGSARVTTGSIRFKFFLPSSIKQHPFKLSSKSHEHFEHFLFLCHPFEVCRCE